MTPARRVDTHFHVFRAGVALPGARYTPGYNTTLEAWQATAAATVLWDAVAQMGWHVELHTDTGALPGGRQVSLQTPLGQ
jgi:predicted TIM-barrel fold metal-dependent hydrolase